VPSLEERVTILEAQLAEIRAESDHATTMAVVAAREALTARDAHRKNIELLNALRVTQAEHTATLAGHTATLADHTSRLDAIDGKLGQLTVGVHTIESLLRRLVDDEGR
jgi:hypothetical protein